MSFMQPSTCRPAVLAMLAGQQSSGPRAPAGKPSAASWRVISGSTNACRGRRLAARTAGAKTQNSVSAWVTSRHLRRWTQKTLAYQSSEDAGRSSVIGLPRSSSRRVVQRRSIQATLLDTDTAPSARPKPSN